jgi:hypothetical protein
MQNQNVKRKCLLMYFINKSSCLESKFDENIVSFEEWTALYDRDWLYHTEGIWQQFRNPRLMLRFLHSVLSQIDHICRILAYYDDQVSPLLKTCEWNVDSENEWWNISMNSEFIARKVWQSVSMMNIWTFIHLCVSLYNILKK